MEWFQFLHRQLFLCSNIPICHAYGVYISQLIKYAKACSTYFFVCLFEQFFSYLVTVTITGDRAANLGLCLALTAFSNEGSFTCHTYCDTGPSFLRSYPKDPWVLLINAVLLTKEQSLPILNVLGLMQPAREGLELMFDIRSVFNSR
jgi:hypothetical protein